MKNYLIPFLFLLSLHLQGQNINQILDSKPFAVSGSLGGNLGLYSVSGIDGRTSPFQYGLSARINFKIYSFNIPVYAAIRDNSLNYGGTFSRFRINPQYKWIKLHIGDAYLSFNPYTLSGRTVNGIGVELTPGKLRFKFIKGKIEDLRAYRDSLELGTTLVPTYSRKMTGIGMGFGSNSTYLDLYGIQASDRLDSLNGERVLEEFTRKSNTVVGGTVAVKLSNRVNVRSNAGLSFQTDNLDSYGDNTVIGENPLTNNLIEANISSTYTYAGDIALNYTGSLFSLNTKVKYIQPYFQPLTVAYVNTDIIHYTIGGSTALFNRKLNLMGSIGIQKNNLSGNKLSTANNLITNFIANFRLSKSLSGTINYSNFTQDFEARLVQINDLYTYAVNSSVASVSLRYSFDSGDNRYSTTVRVGKNNFLTVDNSEEELGAYSSWNSALNVAMNNSEKHQRISASITYRKYERQVATTANYGIRLNASKAIYDNKLKLTFNSGFSFNDQNGFREGSTWRNGFNAIYTLNDKSNFGILLNHIQRKSNVRSDFTEFRGGVQYLYSF